MIFLCFIIELNSDSDSGSDNFYFYYFFYFFFLRNLYHIQTKIYK